MRSSLTSASYIALSFLLWSKAEATDQDLSASSQYSSVPFSENLNNLATISVKRKREDDFEKIDSPHPKRVKFDTETLIHYPELPDDIKSVIANFIEDPFTFQNFKKVSKSWNHSASKEHYLIPSNSQKVIEWVLSFKHPHTMKFNTEAFINDFMARNKRTMDSYNSLSFSTNEYVSKVSEDLKLVNETFNDLSPIAKTLLKEIKLQETMSSFVPSDNDDFLQKQAHFKKLLLKWQPYGIILHLNYFLSGDISRGFLNIEKMAQRYPEISHFLLYPYDIDAYLQPISLNKFFNNQLTFLNIADQIARIEAFKSFKINNHERFNTICSSYLTTIENAEEIKEPNVYPRLKKEIKFLKEQIKSFTQKVQLEETLPYSKQITKLYEAHTFNLKQKLLVCDSFSINTFNIQMAYSLMLDFEDAQNRLCNAYSNLAQTYEKLGKRYSKKELFSTASQFYTEAAHYVMKYMDIADSDQEYDWLSQLYQKAAETIDPISPASATELRLKSEQACQRELNIF